MRHNSGLNKHYKIDSDALDGIFKPSSPAHLNPPDDPDATERMLAVNPAAQTLPVSVASPMIKSSVSTVSEDALRISGSDDSRIRNLPKDLTTTLPETEFPFEKELSIPVSVSSGYLPGRSSVEPNSSPANIELVSGGPAHDTLVERPRPKQGVYYLKRAVLLLAVLTTSLLVWRIYGSKSPTARFSSEVITQQEPEKGPIPTPGVNGAASRDSEAVSSATGLENKGQEPAALPASDSPSIEAQEIPKKTISSGALLPLPLHFALGAWKTADGVEQVRAMAKEMQQIRGNILIIGYSVPYKNGSPPRYDLGIKRARFVRQMLIRGGVNAERIQLASHGMASPWADSSASGAKQVEMHIDPQELSASTSLDEPNRSPSSNWAEVLDENIARITRGEVVSLPLRFGTGMWKTKDGVKQVRLLAARIRAEQGLIQLHGHSDIRGGSALNLIIGLWRAEFVRRLMLEEGVDPKRIIIASRGSTQPRTNKYTLRAMDANRRVEIRIVQDTKIGRSVNDGQGGTTN